MPVTDLHAHHATAPKVVQGRIANTPATAADSLFVILPSFDPTRRWGPCSWPPYGQTRPTAGDSCLVAFDDLGLAWVLQWTPAAPALVWHPLSYAAGWSNIGSGDQIGSYALDALGFVHIRGFCTKSSAWANSETIATLPAGFRPALNERFDRGGVDATAGHVLFIIRVDNAGGISIRAGQIPTVVTPAAMSSLTLAGITYEQAA